MRTIVLCGGARDGTEIHVAPPYPNRIEIPEVERPVVADLVEGPLPLLPDTTFRQTLWAWDGTRTPGGAYRFRQWS